MTKIIIEVAAFLVFTVIAFLVVRRRQRSHAQNVTDDFITSIKAINQCTIAQAGEKITAWKAQVPSWYVNRRESEIFGRLATIVFVNINNSKSFEDLMHKVFDKYDDNVSDQLMLWQVVKSSNVMTVIGKYLDEAVDSITTRSRIPQNDYEKILLKEDTEKVKAFLHIPSIRKFYSHADMKMRIVEKNL